MAVFEEMFIESKGKPVIYAGKEICLVVGIPVTEGQVLRVYIETTNSEWRQGVLFWTKGSMEVNGVKIKNKTVLWQDTAPDEVTMKIMTKSGKCRVKNVWDNGRCAMDSGVNGAAMIVEELPNGFRYRCNDGHPDDDFDDIVFRIELGSK